jgi:phytanoyl-CoA hydroxylase
MAKRNEAGMLMEMKTNPEPQFDQGQIEHPAELYREIRSAQSLDGLEEVDDAAISLYNRDGFLAIENAFTPEDMENAKQGMNNLVMGRREGFHGILFESKARDLLPTLRAEERLDAVRKFTDFVQFEPLLHALAFHPKLLAILDRIIGEKPHLFQDMALIKPPRIGREKPWHQDHAYFDFPLGTRVVGVWIAVDEATVENGCMRVLPGGHREGPRLHFQRRDWQICDTSLTGAKPVAVPLRPGGLMLFDGLLPHGTPTNHSPHRRRALQYHYHGQSVRKTTTAERLQIFGSEGKNVSC